MQNTIKRRYIPPQMRLREMETEEALMNPASGDLVTNQNDNEPADEPAYGKQEFTQQNNVWD